jgi:phosphatidylethanolamine/phosphatidyl-N-methylethanolamine N-methyltransferase
MSADTLTFFRAWLSDPLRVASVVPSGERLAELITRDIDPARGPVLELGPGTGVFTQALVRRGVRPADLTLVELGTEFADILALRYPEATIMRMNAASLPRLRHPAPRLHGAAISGLPLLSMPPAKVLRILAGTFRLLAPHAGLYQFTYGWRCPAPVQVLNRLELKVGRIGGTFANFPPAAVYRISRG